ncbi:M56 family metallopeptidase [Singulisphaera sp. PoT]|uniref:M56 family metallopeptidase n=1 Tax=Singulisphaera sp. PoT TaxID=3411797 RepID=UPI003BF5A450
MNILHVLDQAIWRQLVFALLHTLWQGGAIALIAALILWRIPANRPGLRYTFALAAQFGILLAGLLTWAVLRYESPRAEVVASAPAGVGSMGLQVITGGKIIGAPPAEAPVPSSVAAGEPSRTRWVPMVAAAWLVGVGLMLVRATTSAFAAFRLTRGEVIADSRILEMLAGLKRELGIRRPIRAVVGEGGLGPAVLGLAWPTLILPASLLTGIAPDALRAILAHELAHIRRYDYAVNLVQMFFEALLFFNPAVWWLGRQARLEREACCDARAVHLTGQPLEYSRVLADWCEQARGRSRSPVAATAWAGGGASETLLERVLRILRPGELPRVRVSWSGLLVLFLVGPLTLIALQRGTTKAVALAAQILDPAERIEKLKQAQAKFDEICSHDDVIGKATLKGTIRDPEGQPISEPVAASAMTRSPRGGGVGVSLLPLKETFSTEVASGTVWINLQPKDFAPMIVGPFTAKSGATIDGIDVVLERGFSAKLRVVDENGTPVVGARVGYGLTTPEGSVFQQNDHLTDRDGVVLVPHAARGPYSVSVHAAGFQTPALGSQVVTLSPEATSTLNLAHARPAQGIIIGPDGAPVAGATLRPFAKFRPQMSYSYGMSEPIMATTTPDGRFKLDTLDDDDTYTMLIETPHLGRRLVKDVRAGQSGLRWTVGPDLSINGTIRGNIDRLPKERGKPIVQIVQHGKPDSTRPEIRGSLIRSTLVVEPAEGGGRFKAVGLLPGEVTVEAGEQVALTDVESPETPVVIDLSAPLAREAQRKVIFRIVPIDGSVMPTGMVDVHATESDRTFLSQIRELTLRSGEVSLDLLVPGKVSCQPKSVVGYWFNDEIVDVPPGDSPFVIEIKAKPAGAIVGRVLKADGTSAATSAYLGVSTVTKPSGLEMASIQVNNIRTDSAGRFFLGPLPIGGTYVVSASEGYNKQVSKPIKLDGTKATEEVELRMGKVATGRGRVLDPEGRPLAGISIGLKLEHPVAGTDWGPPIASDRKGEFQFEGLGTEGMRYKVKLDIRKDFEPAEAYLNPGGAPTEVQLKRGHVIIGRVVDVKTGWAIPGLEVYAHRERVLQGERFGFESEARTDTEGRFRFSNLPDVPLQLGVRDASVEGPGTIRALATEQASPVEIRVTLPEWSKLKPVPPTR